MNQDEKYFQYAAVITGKIAELFDEDSESSYKIDINELKDSKNLTQFIHALANLAPNSFYNKMTNDTKNNLEFNHIANHLCFQYSKKEE